MLSCSFLVMLFLLFFSYLWYSQNPVALLKQSTACLRMWFSKHLPLKPSCNQKILAPPSVSILTRHRGVPSLRNWRIKDFVCCAAYWSHLAARLLSFLFPKLLSRIAYSGGSFYSLSAVATCPQSVPTTYFVQPFFQWGGLYGERQWWHTGVLDMVIGRLLLQLLRVTLFQERLFHLRSAVLQENIRQQAGVGIPAALHAPVRGLPEAECSRSGGNLYPDSPWAHL